MLQSRRRFLRQSVLRGSGVALALPLLGELREARGDDPATPPLRMVTICNNLGLHADYFNPEGTGRGWKASKYLALLEDFRDQMTVITGVSHPEVDGGHNAEKSFLTTAPHPSGGSFKNTISLDQHCVARLGGETRVPYLALGVNTGRSLSWTRSGVPIPAEQRPSRVFGQLFLEGSKAETASRVQKLRQGQSVMDAVLDQARRLDRSLAPADRHKFDEYLTSVREVEQGLVRQQEWAKTPKPKVRAKAPRDIRGNGDIVGKSDLMFDLMHLALETDSTRFITLLTAGHFIVPPVDGVTEGYHTVSHHGQNAEKLAQLALIETAQLQALRQLLVKLRGTREGGGTLLDSTMVLYGANMGNASSHDNRNLPTMLFGGRFRHGQYLKFAADDNEPLANLFVTMMQSLGLEDDRFGISGLRTLPGLELA